MGEPRTLPELFTLTGQDDAPNGAWCWYQDERVMIDTRHPDGAMLLASTISFSEPGDLEHGDIDLLWRNLSTGQQGAFELKGEFFPDDHNNAAIHVRADGRYLAVYTGHSSDRDVRWRTSTQPHNPTKWDEEKTLTNAATVCYSNIVSLNNDVKGESRLLNFARSDGFDPNYFVSDDQGSTWHYGGKLLTGPSGNKAKGQRPYMKYAEHAGEAVHFMATDGHPRNEDNGIYHGYLQSDKLHQTDGQPMGPLSTERVSPYASSQFTTVMAAGTRFAGTPMHRAWTIDLQVDKHGHPYGAFSARADGNAKDHRFFYSRWDGKHWNVIQIAKAGDYLYKHENDYTGLVALHPHDPNTLFISTPIDPRDDAKLKHYEIFMGVTADDGKTWAWTPITWDSSENNLRPVVPIWDEQNTALLWLRGTIRSYKDWDAQVVGFTLPSAELHSLGVPGQATVSCQGIMPDAASGRTDNDESD